MLPDENIKCPYTAFKTSCFDGVTKHKCPKWVRIVGSDPQTGQPVDHFGCNDRFAPMLMIENSQQQRQTAAAVESFRNEMLLMNTGPLPTLRAPLPAIT